MPTFSADYQHHADRERNREKFYRMVGETEPAIIDATRWIIGEIECPRCEHIWVERRPVGDVGVVCPMCRLTNPKMAFVPDDPDYNTFGILCDECNFLWFEAAHKDRVGVLCPACFHFDSEFVWSMEGTPTLMLRDSNEPEPDYAAPPPNASYYGVNLFLIPGTWAVQMLKAVMVEFVLTIARVVHGLWQLSEKLAYWISSGGRK